MTTNGKVVLERSMRDLDQIAVWTNGRNPPYRQGYGHIFTHYVCMRAAGWHDADPESLHTLSGTGLLFVYHPKLWEVKHSARCVGGEEKMAEVFGFGWEWQTFQDGDSAWEIIRESIDSGRPVKGDLMECSVFLGYEDTPAKQDRKVLIASDPLPGADGDRAWWTWERLDSWAREHAGYAKHGHSYANRLGWHTEKLARPEAKALALQTLKDAVAWADTPPAAATKPWEKLEQQPLYGLAGLAAFAHDIADVGNKPSKYFDSAWRGCHAVNPQLTSRYATAAWLKRIAGDGMFGGKVAQHLQAAAAAYERVHAAWQEFYRQLGHKAPKNAWDLEENRTTGAAAMHEVAEQEEAGVGETRKALEIAG